MSAKSVAEKLLIRANTTVWSSNRSRLDLLGPLPRACVSGQADQATTAFFFAEDAASLRKVLTTHMDRLARPDILWVAYPKGNGR